MSAGHYLSAVPPHFSSHKRASSSSSVASYGPPSPVRQNIYTPRIITPESTYIPTEYDYNVMPKQPQSMPDTSMLQGNFGAVDMRRIHSSGNEGQSISTLSHSNSPATPQAFSSDDYDDMTQSAAFQQSMMDVFPDQMSQQYPALKMAHRHNMQERIQEVQAQHLQQQQSGNTSNPRQRPSYSGARPERNVQQSRPAPLQTQRTSVSPKELLLDESEVPDNQPPLFPTRMPPNLRQQSSMSNFYNMPSLNTEASIQIPQNYPFTSQPSSQVVSGDSEPAFRPPMLSMESTNEEGPSQASSQQSNYTQQQSSRTSAPVSRPQDLSSGAGTYSCTYHGCPQRFDSPARLQKHKRDAHRLQDSTSAAAALALRNSQAGPHRCDRINPSTGKPCNSIFSRPYDLTRHEDTIHNNRKTKVRCHLCSEEKTFSRNDALTRHMRVVHPDVDWVGKQKKRSHKM